jgi:hypothetical protein
MSLWCRLTAFLALRFAIFTMHFICTPHEKFGGAIGRPQMQLSPLFFDPLLFVFFFRDLFLESISGRNITDLPSKSLFTSNQ